MEYTFDGSEGRPIDLDTARIWIATFQRDNPGHTKAHFFGREILHKILNEDGCMGIRIYYAQSENAEDKLILVGADSHGGNLLPGKNTDSEYILADYSLPCPRYCPPSGGIL